MSVNLKILVPDGTTNYIQNPAFRYDTTGWGYFGASIARVLDHALYGIASLRVVTDGLALREGAYYRVNGLVGISEPITISAYVRGQGTVHLRLIESLGNEWVSKAVTLYSDRWTRMEVSGYTTGGDDVRLYVETDSRIQAITYYVDGAQMERKSYATTYCDGEQPGCRWNIVDSASNSSRDAYTRAGGRWVSLAGPCRDNDDIYLTYMGGMGMPYLQNNVQPWALSPGSYFQNVKVNERTVQMVFHVKRKDLRITKNPDRGPLHKLRQQLIDIFKPDRTGGDEPFLFSYQEGDRELFIHMRYDGGLEGDWDTRNQWIDNFPIRFLAVDPYFTENNQHSLKLNFMQRELVNHIAQRINGEWSDMNYGLSSTVAKIALGIRGEIYAGGIFTQANYDAAAIDPFIPAAYIAKWDGTKWNTMGTPANGTITDVAVAPNGDVYVGGTFTAISGIAANYIAKWNGTSWSALGTGANAEVMHISIAPNGDVYAGGKFTTIGGVSVGYIARWDGSSWHAIGAKAGLNNYVYSIAIRKDGSEIYAAGKFTDQLTLAASALLRVTKYNPTTNVFSTLGNGFNDDVNEIVLSPAEKLYCCGAFTLSGSTTINRVSLWNGSIWVAMGTGMNNTTNSMDVDKDENIYACGNFTEAGDVECSRISLWNGSAWTNIDVELGGAYCVTVKITPTQNLYINMSLSETNIDHSFINYVTNYGTSEVDPTVYVYGPGQLRWIENQTSKKRVYLDLTILDNEEVFIDFGHARIYSTIRGDLTYGIIPGSDFDDFSLIPGENKLAVFMTDAVDSLMYIYHQPRHWSADATTKAEAL